MKEQLGDSNKNGSQNESQEIWGEENQNFNSIDYESHELCGRGKRRETTQPKRIFGTNGKDRHGINFRGQAFDQQTILQFLKKLVRRLEILEEKHTKYAAEHRSRLIATLKENEDFALEVQPEIDALKEDIAELLGVLGASELEPTTE
ncbi:hypothetical protein [Okeania sp. SIO2B3]|uniref:hypothetical protein n=1 Tax=Okeania sp. SIO2B3 TaxID=2607784 RepID=UPI0013C27C89|nr:hypothetical protein [Okeania sp. SIO2B3]NET44865.1 hypothetical protein [Okeania sp. SIO2B3]